MFFTGVEKNLQNQSTICEITAEYKRENTTLRGEGRLLLVT